MLKVLFAASEAAPMAKVGGLGDVAGALPKALKDLGVDARLILPKYRPIETPNKIPGSEVPVYYVSSLKYFERDLIYGYDDDPKRFAFFCKALLDLTKNIGFKPDIIHINDYHTGLVPTLLKVEYAKDDFFKETKTLLTIHNLANQGEYNPSVLNEIGLKSDSTPILGEDTRDGDVDMLFEGVSEADLVVAVSPTYAKEILTPEYGDGLVDKLNERRDRLRGVLNGIDTYIYNPQTDPNIVSNYSLKTIEKKSENKAALIKELGLSNPERPLFGMVSRLVAQKGFDLILEAGETLAKLPLNFVILGLGEPKFENGLRDLASKYANFKLVREFSEAKSREIYAGSDFFLVPSRFEPCGLTQMVSMRYGTIPIVRKTGGLADTVFDEENGLVFEKYDATEMLNVVKRALEMFNRPKEMARTRHNGMTRDFSWNKSAKEYVKLYQETLTFPRNLL